MATTTNERATMAQTPHIERHPPEVKRGFGKTLRCPMCGVPGAVRVDLADVSRFECTECSELFTSADVRQMMAEWGRVLTWCEQAPTL